MRIMMLNQFFWPDEQDGAEYLTDLARHLAAMGHEVTVICGRRRSVAREREEAPPVSILRVPEMPFTERGPLRLLFCLWFLAAAACRGLLAPRADIVLTLTRPALGPLIGAMLKATRKSRHFIWEMELYPDLAVDLRKLAARSSLAQALQRVTDFSRWRADGILAAGDSMRERLLLRGLAPRKIHVAECWADGREIHPQPLPGEPFTVLCSGDLGMTHEIQTVVAAMNLSKTNGRLRFVFAGEGPLRKELETHCRRQGLGNVGFLSDCRRAGLGANLAQAHVGLVTQRRETVGSVVPARVYAWLAAGRPFVFVGPRGATPNRIIERFQCGWQIDCGDAKGLVALLEALVRNPGAVREAGLRARKAFEAHYDLPEGVSRVCEALGILAPVPRTVPAAPERPLELVASHSSVHR